MAIFKSSNPVLTDKAFEKSMTVYDADVVKMTEKGTLNKFFLLSLLVMATAALTWSAYFQGKDVWPYILVGAFGGFICAVVLAFKPKLASILGPIYALLEGAFVGGVSAYYQFAFQKQAPGIVMQAVVITFGVVIAMFLLYRFQIIKVTEKFKAIVITATVGLIFFYLIAWGLSFAHIDIPFLHEGSALGIGFSLLVIGLASMNLIMAFDRVEKGVAMGAPKYMEWYSAFGLVVVIVWLYIEVLNLLGKLNSRN
ncbi:MAG TPA: Bax inhibitor-1/YccA family protein [Chitinophagaceae bacterium]|nr:Bax inhibitor-1/YccA family protein [Chitinophagaceae bacterium]